MMVPPRLMGGWTAGGTAACAPCSLLPALRSNLAAMTDLVKAHGTHAARRSGVATTSAAGVPVGPRMLGPKAFDELEEFLAGQLLQRLRLR